jgi:hypothetical protein
MRITESRLRRIIREEARKVISEAPWAGDIGSVEGEDLMGPSYNLSWLPPYSERVAGRNAARALSNSSGFRKLATRLYGNFPLPVWTAPYIGNLGLSGLTLGGDRGKMMDLQQGLDILRGLGYSKEALSKIDVSNDLVILYASEKKVGLGEMATPWMIFHAIFDSNIPEEAGLDGILALREIWEQAEIDDDRLPPEDEDEDYEPPTGPRLLDKINAVMTTRSARDSNMNTPSDAPNEQIVQQLITRGGLRYNEDKLDRLDAADQQLFMMSRELVKRVADSFTHSAVGKLIMINVD